VSNAGCARPVPVPGEAGLAPDDPVVVRALLHGNFEQAVARCLSLGRVADALVLAAAGGQDLWVATRDTYLWSKGGVFAQVRAITHGDWGAYVAQSALGAWKETLGLLATYASVGELRALSGQLGARLEASDAAAATLCHMCAADAVVLMMHGSDRLPPLQQADCPLHRLCARMLLQVNRGYCACPKPQVTNTSDHVRAQEARAQNIVRHRH